jgi:hypothetical protein
MKKRNIIIGLLFTSTLFVVVSCTKTSNDDSDSIEGTYYGTYSRTASLKSTQSDSRAADNATAEVTKVGENLIEVYCDGDEIDTTFMLNYYMQYDSAMVCLTGDDFENIYGHMLGAGHMGGGMMGGGMMGDIGDNETEWMHHLNDEHQPGDEHFGGFDLKMGTFTYYLRMTDETEPYYMKFSGSKEK